MINALNVSEACAMTRTWKNFPTPKSSSSKQQTCFFLPSNVLTLFPGRRLKSPWQNIKNPKPRRLTQSILSKRLFSWALAFGTCGSTHSCTILDTCFSGSSSSAEVLKDPLKRLLESFSRNQSISVRENKISHKGTLL